MKLGSVVIVQDISSLGTHKHIPRCRHHIRLVASIRTGPKSHSRNHIHSINSNRTAHGRANRSFVAHSHDTCHDVEFTLLRHFAIRVPRLFW